MPTVEIYTTMWCPYCAKAKKLLREKGAEFTEIDVDAEPARRAEMVQRAGGRTSVPQIFIDATYVGGCDDLHAMDRMGRLDPMLKGA